MKDMLGRNVSKGDKAVIAFTYGTSAQLLFVEVVGIVTSADPKNVVEYARVKTESGSVLKMTGEKLVVIKS